MSSFFMLDSSGAAFGLHTFCPNKSLKDLQKVIKCVISNLMDVSQNRTLLFKTMYNSRGHQPHGHQVVQGPPELSSVCLHRKILMHLLHVFLSVFSVLLTYRPGMYTTATLLVLCGQTHFLIQCHVHRKCFP